MGIADRAGLDPATGDDQPSRGDAAPSDAPIVDPPRSMLESAEPAAAAPLGDIKPAEDSHSASQSVFSAVLDAADSSSANSSAMSQSASRPQSQDDDLRAAIKVSTPAAKFPVLDPDHPEFQSILRQVVVQQIQAHADENPGVEVCGILVGTVYENPQASFVHIDGMIRGEGSGSRSTQVTFTAETWQHVHQVMEQKHAGKRIIGWYHTHPGFGIFLSEMDLFIQRNFFNAPWQVAFVLDPKDQDAGMFAWRAAQVRRVDFVVDDDASPVTSASVAAALPKGATTSVSPVFHEEPTAPINAATLEEFADRIRVLELRVKWMLAGFAILLVVAIIWPLVMTILLPTKPSSAEPTPSSPQSVKPAEDSSAGKPDPNFPVLPPLPK